MKKYVNCMPPFVISLIKSKFRLKNRNMIIFRDYRRQHEEIKDNFYKELKQILSFYDDRDHFFYEKEFESRFAKLCGKNYAITMSSGTAAIQFSLGMQDFEDDSAIITVPNTYPGAILAITNLNHSPLFVDIKNDTFNIDPNQIEGAITDKTKAIIVTHLYGHPADIERIQKIAKKNNLFFIEDCAHSFGAKINGDTMPYGDLGIFSFHTSKILGGFGNGGVIVTNKRKYKFILEEMKEPLSCSKETLKSRRTPSYMDEMQIAMVNAKIPFVDAWIKKRQDIAKYYSENFSDLPIQTPIIRPNFEHSFFSYTIKTKDSKTRNNLKNYLFRKGIETRILYNPLPHRSEAFKENSILSSRLKNFEQIHSRILSLPIYPQLKKEEIDKIINCIKKFYKHN